ncbi:MAG: cyclic nucleotide-binding domain-containing protein [Deinococcus sp.]|nr:cyclic nucleotide-binding domain-containing protein [Deinococcus sp.]
MKAENPLARAPLFANLDARQVDALAKGARRRSFNPGATMVYQGELGIGLYVLASGRAEVRRKDAEGREHVLASLGPGDFFGEMALLYDAPRTASVVAVEPTECLVLTRMEFKAALRSSPEIAVELLEVLGKRLQGLLGAS